MLGDFNLYSMRHITMAHTNTLRQCWSTALDLEMDDISDSSNFFDLGGDSVQAIRLAEVARRRGLKLDVENVFTCPDFKDMLANSEQASSTEASVAPFKDQLDPATVRACADTCGVGPEWIEDIFPTVEVQDRLMEAHIRSGAFLMQLVFELQGTRDTEHVCKAFDTIRDENQVLRTRLVRVDSGVLQVAFKDPIKWHHAKGLKEYLTSDAKSWMEYGQPLVRHAVVQESEKTYVVWTCHHSVMDGWTRRLLLEDLDSYLANPVAFFAKPHRPPFKNFVNYRRSLKAEEAKAFFEKYLAELPNTRPLYTIPDDHKLSTNRIITREISIDRPTRSTITFPNMAQAAFALAVGQVTESHEINLYTIRGSRAISMPGVESIMGPTVSGIFLSTKLPPEEPISTVLRNIQDTAIQILKYEVFSLGYNSALGKNSIWFNWHPLGSDLFSKVARFSVGENQASLRVVQELYPNAPSATGLVVNIYDQGDHLRVLTKFDDHVLEVSLIERALDLFAAKLKRICGGQEMSIGSLMT